MISAIPFHPVQKVTQKALQGTKAHAMKLTKEEEVKKKIGEAIHEKSREKAFEFGMVDKKTNIKVAESSWFASEEKKRRYDECEKRKTDDCMMQEVYGLNEEVSSRV